jgi:hypothetical protein
MSHPTPATARERFVRWQPRFELCAVCRSPTHGFGWQEPQRMIKPRPPARMVLFHGLPNLLLGTRPEVSRHG